MINIIWGIFIIIGILYGLFTGNFNQMNTTILNTGKTTLDLFLTMFPLMIIWSGIMNIAKESGLLKKLTNVMLPVLSIVFPELDKDSEELEYISTNLAINMLGIHNASTPFGLKAMKIMQEKSKNKNEATRSMITFLVLNTSGVTLIATDIIAVRMMYNSASPTSLIVPTIIVTVTNTLFAIFIDRYFYKKERDKYDRKLK